MAFGCAVGCELDDAVKGVRPSTNDVAPVDSSSTDLMTEWPWWPVVFGWAARFTSVVVSGLCSCYGISVVL